MQNVMTRNPDFAVNPCSERIDKICWKSFEFTGTVTIEFGSPAFVNGSVHGCRITLLEFVPSSSKKL